MSAFDYTLSILIVAALLILLYALASVTLRPLDWVIDWVRGTKPEGAWRKILACVCLTLLVAFIVYVAFLQLATESID